MVQGSEFRVQGSEFRVLSSRHGRRRTRFPNHSSHDPPVCLLCQFHFFFCPRRFLRCQNVILEGRPEPALSAAEACRPPQLTQRHGHDRAGAGWPSSRQNRHRRDGARPSNEPLKSTVSQRPHLVVAIFEDGLLQEFLKKCGNGVMEWCFATVHLEGRACLRRHDPTIGKTIHTSLLRLTLHASTCDPNPRATVPRVASPPLCRLA
jgi:hypothetical protein